METRSKRQRENDELDGKIFRAVCGKDDKCDNVNNNSIFSGQLSYSRLKLDWALLRKRNLEKRLKLEIQLKMLDIQEEVYIAKLECKVDEFNGTDTFRNGYSDEDKSALEVVGSSCKLEGLFQVGLPWKHDRPSLPNNFELAERRLEYLRKRFTRDNSLLEKYQAVMNKHLSKSYIIKASKEGFGRDAVRWYIPHHPVINPKKLGKLRIIFYCAAVYQGCSLNDQLLRGPNTVNSLIGVLLRFRLGNVALAADIEEMFLEVKISRRKPKEYC
ncbi:unnamed protein product [Schistosoma curassoni]|uniref:DUF1758 domain-containing protein n=1 Tax=Schistosoma curassoni TaxID=6186 RepID=A0A183L1P8_9TREM|nr:unnamed protein product [Schistosoma curassoni]